MDATGYAGPMGGLPDPDLDRQFYDGVPTARASSPGSST